MFHRAMHARMPTYIHMYVILFFSCRNLYIDACGGPFDTGVPRYILSDQKHHKFFTITQSILWVIKIYTDMEYLFVRLVLGSKAERQCGWGKGVSIVSFSSSRQQMLEPFFFWSTHLVACFVYPEGM